MQIFVALRLILLKSPEAFDTVTLLLNACSRHPKMTKKIFYSLIKSSSEWKEQCFGVDYGTGLCLGCLGIIVQLG